MENQLQANRKFAQIPNKMFYGTENNEKLIYVLLQATQLAFPIDEKIGMSKAFIHPLTK